ncbi:AMP dependent ligase [Anopheles darlingi]|uniref:AMP dependent ligase n=1 Tax=Anopheles darlingi TaxID=43151 RepID=W5JNB7_ANODA|nr:AMP dependent ligase [Anopheles darlingi]
MALCTYDEQSRTWYGPRVTPVYNPAASVGQIFNDILLRSPNRIIQIDVDTGAQLSCAEFRKRMIRAVQNLASVGLAKGDIVALANGNSENVGPLFCALLTLGATVNPLAPGFNKQDMAHMLRLTQPKMIFCEDSNYEIVKAASAEAIQGNSPPLFVVESERKDVRHAEELLKETGREESFFPPQIENSREAISLILCSSGSTGLPKGVCWSHAHIINMLGSYPIADSTVSFSFSPLYWGSALFTMIGSFGTAATRLITRKSFCVETFFKAVEQYRASFIFMPPSYANQVVRHERVTEVDFSSVKMLSLGGSFVSEELRDRFDRLLPKGRTFNTIGISEIAWVTCDIGQRKRGSVGTPMINVSAKIVDEVTGQDLGIGERGEVLLRFLAPFNGYYGNPEATKATIEERGYTRSGDIGYFDKDGYLYLIDRQKDIFKYRGFHVSPSELESIVERLDGVREVCVVAVPEDAENTSEMPAAVIVRQDGSTLDAAQIVRFVEEQVSDFKRLRGGVHFFEELPKTQSGKILRRKVQEMVLAKICNNSTP